jgi:hypothetical protein
LGAGDEAGRIAGRIRHAGRFVMLIPREVDLVEAGRKTRLPAPKPRIAALEAAKQDDKAEGKGEPAGAGAAGRKGRAHSANALATTTVRQKLSRAPTATANEIVKESGKRNTGATDAGLSAAGKSAVSPVPKPKSTVTDVKEQRRGKTESAGTSGSGKSSPTSMKSSDVKARNQDASGKTNSSAVGGIPGSKQKPWPAQKSKPVRTDVKNGKAKAESANPDGHERAAAKSGGQAIPTRKSDRF